MESVGDALAGMVGGLLLGVADIRDGFSDVELTAFRGGFAAGHSSDPASEFDDDLGAFARRRGLGSSVVVVGGALEPKHSGRR